MGAERVIKKRSHFFSFGFSVFQIFFRTSISHLDPLIAVR
jgi:hypothetical protein